MSDTLILYYICYHFAKNRKSSLSAVKTRLANQITLLMVAVNSEQNFILEVQKSNLFLKNALEGTQKKEFLLNELRKYNKMRKLSFL